MACGSVGAPILLNGGAIVALPLMLRVASPDAPSNPEISLFRFIPFAAAKAAAAWAACKFQRKKLKSENSINEKYLNRFLSNFQF